MTKPKIEFISAWLKVGVMVDDVCVGAMLTDINCWASYDILEALTDTERQAVEEAISARFGQGHSTVTVNWN